MISTERSHVSTAAGEKRDEIQSTKSNLGHIQILGPLRGFAALSVCLFHFSNGNREYLDIADPIKHLGSYGWLGVEIFFVISGFIIPLSMHMRSYKTSDIGGFLYRRFKRIQPPYITSIFIVIALDMLVAQVPGFAGNQFKFDPTQFLHHIAYLNDFSGFPWYNPVYWTLAIEFQFYIFMGLTFSLFCSDSRLVNFFSTPAFGSLVFTGAGSSWIASVMPLFCMGIACFQYLTNLIGFKSFLLSLSLISLIGLAKLGLLKVACGLLTCLVIVGVRDKKPHGALNWLSWVGGISFSLYLIHVPIGGKIINLFGRLPDYSFIRYLGILTALAASILASCLLWNIVESPSLKWSKK